MFLIFSYLRQCHGSWNLESSPETRKAKHQEDDKRNYDASSASSVITFVDSGSEFSGYASQGIVDYIVNNASKSLVVLAHFDTGIVSPPAVRLCGIRISYNLDLSRANLPIVLNQAQP